MSDADSLRLNRSHVVFILSIILLVALFVGVRWFLADRAVKQEVGTAASEALATTATTSFSSLDGQKFEFATLRGKPRVLTIWATWSPLSVDDIRLVNELASEYEAADVSFVLLNRSETAARAESYLDRFTMSDKVTVVLDGNDSFYDATGGFAMPETIVYDRLGNIHTHIRGPLREPEIRRVVDGLLEQ